MRPSIPMRLGWVEIALGVVTLPKGYPIQTLKKITVDKLGFKFSEGECVLYFNAGTNFLIELGEISWTQ